MVLLQYGFIVWGLWALYGAVVIAYVFWAIAEQKKDLSEGGSVGK